MELCIDASDEQGAAIKPIEKDTFVAVRVGTDQKQSRYSKSRKFKFLTKSSGRQCAQIEIFKRVGKACVDFDADAPSSRDVVIQCPGFDVPTLSFTVGVQSRTELTPEDKEKRARKKMDETQRYMLEYQLQDCLSASLREVLRSKPSDPYHFLSDQILKTTVTPTSKLLPPLTASAPVLPSADSEFPPIRPSSRPGSAASMRRPSSAGKIAPLQRPGSGNKVAPLDRPSSGKKSAPLDVTMMPPPLPLASIKRMDEDDNEAVTKAAMPPEPPAADQVAADDALAAEEAKELPSAEKPAVPTEPPTEQQKAPPAVQEKANLEAEAVVAERQTEEEPAKLTEPPASTQASDDDDLRLETRLLLLDATASGKLDQAFSKLKASKQAPASLDAEKGGIAPAGTEEFPAKAASPIMGELSAAAEAPPGAEATGTADESAEAEAPPEFGEAPLERQKQKQMRTQMLKLIEPVALAPIEASCEDSLRLRTRLLVLDATASGRLDEIFAKLKASKVAPTAVELEEKKIEAAADAQTVSNAEQSADAEAPAIAEEPAKVEEPADAQAPSQSLHAETPAVVAAGTGVLNDEALRLQATEVLLDASASGKLDEAFSNLESTVAAQGGEVAKAQAPDDEAFRLQVQMVIVSANESGKLDDIFAKLDNTKGVEDAQAPTSSEAPAKVEESADAQAVSSAEVAAKDEASAGAQAPASAEAGVTKVENSADVQASSSPEAAALPESRQQEVEESADAPAKANAEAPAPSGTEDAADVQAPSSAEAPAVPEVAAPVELLTEDQKIEALIDAKLDVKIDALGVVLMQQMDAKFQTLMEKLTSG